ncbi:serine/threonine-protein phosphatase 4 regulatory subunit 1-like isoform X2 [Anopheles stephensi]|uniref:serine/threonine-protein phosphatase 4 regulatory subunit 1-like isoform X2 n=1 Tax=Anopheles stephensi TaxID=30069 RepID=UPI0016587537|nr:serine/threonine-protein phosphatase 4 regulatory subunit 1-like isoform X2 [Anopheles stephensi]XP_035906838.1 serine/threonine-protein phosphatase 4 regulatory subunit 1-like isoform X2 [Anopheles stephensi]XP_035906839.1 serine/threonine-protein phosphatase 4 regulatory subunit 1-like isoform X2 [Anopheles stephensi]XP_035906840.1 serine/threonine-protein phosphatase 4 regulatory subunit 1-like isoform X2 [Anopheles stephensi]XP_035906841.1 serine/threonine-protein phosphatase 4 regulator
MFFAPNFGDLVDDRDPVSSLKKIATAKEKHARDYYPRVLEHIINTQSPQVLCRDYKEILGTLDIISTDPDESVRLYLSCWLQKYCSSWFDRDQDLQSIFSKAFLEKILQIIVRYLTDEPNVRASSFESLTYLIEKGYLDRATTLKLNIVEELVSKPINEQFMDMCTNYIHLMVKIAPLVGCAKTHELLYSRFVKMCTCKINFVRKECATAFPVMCEVLGNEVFEKNLLPIFMKLCEDEIWTVRKACAEVMPFIALLCTLEKRRKVLVPAYKKFMFDTSLWVIKAALKNLGRFLATFAQLQILGLAYNGSLELSITNAADEAFSELMGNARQLAHGSQQPAASVLLKNFESYEQRFKDSIQRHALLSLVKSADDEGPGWKSATPRSEDRINVEAYLASLVFVEEHLSQRQSTGSTSDDGGGGISKIADFYYVRHKSLSSSSSIASTSPTPSPLYRANQSYDEKNPLNRFMRYCSPLKNNFEHAFANPSGSDGGDQGGGSDAFDHHGHWESEDDNYGTNHLDHLADLSLVGADIEGGGGGSGVIYDSDNPKHQQADGGGGEAGGLDFIMEAAGEEDENAIDECFNSHQFWYISPGLALDLEFIDKEDRATGDEEREEETDASNNNVVQQEEVSGRASLEGKQAAAPSTVGASADDSRNNNLLLQQGTPGTDARSSASSESATVGGGEPGSSSAGMVVEEDNENQNDSDSSYGSINNNETESNKLIYLYEDLLPPSQSQVQSGGGAATTTGGGGGGNNNNTGANAPGTSGGGGGAGSSSSTVTPTMTTVERIRAAEQLKTLIRWENEEVEWNLLEDFLHMKNVNKELCQDCAYNFPAVVLTFGEKFWPILNRYFFDLCADIQDSVRRTMAASISKIALIIGREQATRDLVPSYTEFLLDADDIKFEVVRTLAEFLRVIDACEHETLMNHLGMCLQPPLKMMNWRFRELAGQQIVELARMHTAIRKENCLLFLTGLAMRLMLDKYDSVRKAGIDAFVECSHEFQQNDKVFEFFNKHFALYSNWRRRQTYVIAAGKMLETDRVEVEIFRKHVFNNVLKLADDAVPNVRIQVAKCLKEIIAPHPKFANDPQVEPTLQKLRTDKDCDVRGHVDGYQSLEEEMAAGGGGGGGGGSSASNASTMMMTSGESDSHQNASSPSTAGSLAESCVSSHLSYAEVTSGYFGSAMSSPTLDQAPPDDEHEMKEEEAAAAAAAAAAGEEEEVQLAGGGPNSERGVDVANEGLADEDEDDCGEEAIEQPTSSMSTDDDAAYCSEMETSSAVSTPSVGTAAVLAATIPSQTGTMTTDTATTSSSNSSNSQVVPSTSNSTDDLSEEQLVNGESVPASTIATATTTTTIANDSSAAPKKGSSDTGATGTGGKIRENFFRKRSKGKK